GAERELPARGEARRESHQEARVCLPPPLVAGGGGGGGGWPPATGHSSRPPRMSICPDIWFSVRFFEWGATFVNTEGVGRPAGGRCEGCVGGRSCPPLGLRPVRPFFFARPN